jgi:iron complex outermembrane receptor protein
MIRSMLLSTAAAVLVPFSPAMAQAVADPAVTPSATEADSGSSAAPVPGNAAKAHEKDDDEGIVVTGSRRKSPDVLGGVKVLDTEEMAHDVKPSLGDTLQDLPGVSSTSFGPSSSRPILRGESGDRAPILVDGISSLDLSSSDPDHAVSINPLTAEKIEVLHGPGALLYTGSAIGGVVNVTDSRIPRKVPSDVDGQLVLNYGTAANERSGNLGVDAPLGGHFVAHADGAYSRYDDLKVGGYLLSEPLRQQALASPDAGVRSLAALRDRLPNTAGRMDDLAGGVAYIDGDLNIGVSVSHHDAKYGVPIRFSLDPAIEAEQPTIDAHQNRADVRANVPIGGFFKLLEFRGGISKYHHAELDPQGVAGSRFYSNGGEARADLVQTERGGWGGTTGVDYLSQDAKIRGDEKYLPDSRKENLSLFTLQTYDAGKLKLEAAGRVDIGRQRAEADSRIADLVAEAGSTSPVGSVPITRNLTAKSASVGGNYEIVPGWRLGLDLSHSERVPSVEELFAFGPHGGSEQFLVGDPNLNIEKSNGAELHVQRTTGPVRIQGSVYYSKFSNFIFEAPTGAIQDGLPVYAQRQGKADYYGFEVEADAKFGKAFGIDWSGELTSDAVRAKIANFGNAPQIPPLRVLGGITGTRGQVDGTVEVEHVWNQNDIAPNETPTAGYTMVNASFDWHAFAEHPELTLSLTANNIFNVNARRHASELKDYAPLGGRDIRLTARLGF